MRKSYRLALLLSGEKLVGAARLGGATGALVAGGLVGPARLGTPPRCAPGEGSRPGTPCQPKSDTVRNRISSPILSSNFTKFWNDSLFIFFLSREFLFDENYF